MFPEQRTAVIVFTNLDSQFGTDAHGLALGIAGMYVPEISLLAMKAKTDPDPARTKRVQEEFVRLAKGEPNYGGYDAPRYPGSRGRLRHPNSSSWCLPIVIFISRRETTRSSSTTARISQTRGFSLGWASTAQERSVAFR
jgi:hypothetical protein